MNGPYVGIPESPPKQTGLPMLINMVMMETFGIGGGAEMTDDRN